VIPNERFFKDNEVTATFFTEITGFLTRKPQPQIRITETISGHVAEARYPGMKEHGTPRYLKMQKGTWLLYRLLKKRKKMIV
jgi:hypothetical protein